MLASLALRSSSRFLVRYRLNLAARSCFSTETSDWAPDFLRPDVKKPSTAEQWIVFQQTVYKYIRQRGQPPPDPKPIDSITTGSREEIVDALQQNISPFDILQTLSLRNITPTVETYNLLGSYYYQKREKIPLHLLRTYWVNQGIPTIEVFPEPPLENEHEQKLFILSQQLASVQRGLIRTQDALTASEEILRAHIQDPRSAKDLISSASLQEKEIKALIGAPDAKQKLSQIQQEREKTINTQIRIRKYLDLIEVVSYDVLSEFEKKLPAEHKTVKVDIFNPIDVQQVLYEVDAQIASYNFTKNFDSKSKSLSPEDLKLDNAQRIAFAKDAIERWSQKPTPSH